MKRLEIKSSSTSFPLVRQARGARRFLSQPGQQPVEPDATGDRIFHTLDRVDTRA